MATSYDLLVKNGRIIDPAQGEALKVDREYERSAESWLPRS